MKVNWRVLKHNPQAPLLVLDLILLVLIAFNLLWLLADSILMHTGTGVLIGRYAPAFMQHYREHWHENLLVYDTAFTLFLIAELLLRWAVAIVRRTYYRWFFYPFVHWYDVLGCIPLPAFRALRLLRLGSILLRLHRLGVVDLSQSGLFRLANRYYRIVLEELSDRIVINVLNGVQREVREGGPLMHRLSDEVLRPHRDAIVPWLAGLLGQTTAHAYGLHQVQLGIYLDQAVRQAIEKNPDVQRLKRQLLFVGPGVEAELQKIVSGLLVQLIRQLLEDTASPGNVALKDVADGLFTTLTTPHAGMDDTLRHIVLDALEMVKAQVSVQQWKREAEAASGARSGPDSVS